MCQKIRILFVSALLLGLALVAPAQGEHRKTMITGPDVFLLFLKPVQEELKLTDKQQKAVEEAFGGAVQSEGDRIMVRLTGGEDMEEMQKTARGVLDDVQRRRLSEIWIQKNGYLTLSEKWVAERVKLTEDQKKSLSKVQDELEEEVQTAFQAEPSEEGHKAVMSARKEAEAKIAKLLTADQKKAFEELKGKEFKGLKEKPGSEK